MAKVLNILKSTKITIWASLALGITSFTFSCNYAHASPSEAKFLQKVAEQYVLAQFPKDLSGKKIEVEAGKVDDRKDYGGKCEGYLTAELRGKDITSSSQVKISCAKPGNEYTIYVPVKVTMLNATLVAARNLARNTVISPADLTTIFMKDSAQQSGTVTDPNILIGSRLKRDVKQGDQIRANSFCVVCKNDKVNIIARSGGLSLKTSGQALEEGAINDSIKVRNLKSKKIIFGVVRAPGEVEIIF